MFSSKPTPLRLWGLFSNNVSDPVPLKFLDIRIEILHNVARVFYTQHYYNAANVLLETEFFFPISPDACFDSFEATFNSTTIKGVVKEKEKAKQEYKEAVQQGRTAAYSEINKETGDIMKVQIGNIPPNTDVTIKYSYLQKLDVSLNKFWCFRLFSALTSRYSSLYNLKDMLNHDIDILSSYPTISGNDSRAYPWNIEVEVQSPSPITYLKSPSHDVITTFGNENHTCSIALNPNAQHLPNKDFVLLYTNGKEEKVDYLLTPFEDGYCAMVTLLADFETSSSEAAFDNFAKAKEIEGSHSLNTIRGEYIFLIDRSGSMEGPRINMAKESLVLFLKSLPQDSYFNVFSFGSCFGSLHTQSVENSQQTIDHSVQQVESFAADLGGTEIYTPLKKIFNTPLKQGYPRFLFLLTDGAVSNTYQVLDLIRANNDKARTFTIGIGNGCSPELIKKGALYGRGKEEFVSDNSQIYEKVIGLLNASLSPCYSDLSLHGDNFDAVVASVSPNPSSLPPLINGQNVTFFMFLRSQAFQQSQKMNLQLRLYDSILRKHRSIDIILDLDNAFENERLAKLAFHDMIKRLEAQKDQISQGQKKTDEILWMDQDDLEKAMLEYSLKYGILCKETAFFCAISDSDSQNENLLQAKVIVPTTLSNDYTYGSALFGAAAPMQGAGSFGFSNPNPTSGLFGASGGAGGLFGAGGGGGLFGASGGAGGMFGSTSAATNKNTAFGFGSSNLFTNQNPSNNRGLSGNPNPSLQPTSSPWGQSNPSNMGGGGGLFGNPSPPSQPTSSPWGQSAFPNPGAGRANVQQQSSVFSSQSNYSGESGQKKSGWAMGLDKNPAFSSHSQAPTQPQNQGLFGQQGTSQGFNNLPQSGGQSQFSGLSLSNSQTTQISNRSYLDVIKKQKFEGSWDSNDQALLQTIFKDINQFIPSLETLGLNSSQAAIWMTVLVLRWLEMVCMNDRKAWLLIYQKGNEWLKGQGVEYESIKDIATPYIKV